MNRLEKLSAALHTALLALAGAMLVGMMVLASANMLLRAVWIPVKGSYELMGFLGALSIALGMGYTQMRKGHIALTLLEGWLPKRVERAIDAFSHLLGLIFFALIAWRTALWSWSLVRTGELSETLHIIFYPFTFAVALGIATLALALLVDFLRSAAQLRRRT